MHLPRITTALPLAIIGFAPSGCGPSADSVDAKIAAKVAEMDAQADRELAETLAVIAETEAAMQPRQPSPALTYDAFRGEPVGAGTKDNASDPAAEQTAVIETR